MRTVLVLVALIVPLSLATAQGPEVVHTQSDVMTHALRGDVALVEGAEAHLFRSPAGVTLSFATRDLRPGHAYTAWWVFVDDPSACAAAPCTVPEVMGNSDAVRSNLTFADSLVAPDDGAGTFVAHLAPGEIANGWFDSAFTDPMGAEVHVVLHDHGPVIASMREDMLTSFRGGCREESLPPSPTTALADGTPGPNSCQMWQFALFLVEPEASPQGRAPVDAPR